MSQTERMTQLADRIYSFVAANPPRNLPAKYLGLDALGQRIFQQHYEKTLSLSDFRSLFEKTVAHMGGVDRLLAFTNELFAPGAPAQPIPQREIKADSTERVAIQRGSMEQIRVALQTAHRDADTTERMILYEDALALCTESLLNSKRES